MYIYIILKMDLKYASVKEACTWPIARVQWLCFLYRWICILTSFNASSHENQEKEASYLLTLGCTELSQVQVGLSSGRHFEYQFLKKLLPQRTFCQGIRVLSCALEVSGSNLGGRPNVLTTCMLFFGASRRIPGH